MINTAYTGLRLHSNDAIDLDVRSMNTTSRAGFKNVEALPVLALTSFLSSTITFRCLTTLVAL